MGQRRIYSFVGTFDFEIIDPVAVRGESMDWTQSEDGEIRMLDGEPIEQVTARAFTMLMDRAALERSGMKWLGGGLVPRLTTPDGQTYTEMTFPDMPVRFNDGGTD